MNSNPSGRSGFITILAVAALLRLSSAGLLADGVGVNSGSNGVPSQVMDGLKVSANGHYLVDAVNGKPVFLLADTAWNLGALKLEEIDTYLQSRGDHGWERFPNAQSLTLEPRTQGHDWVVVIEDASRNYPLPKAD